MTRVTERSKHEAQYIMEQAPLFSQRTGQFLFNSLRHEISLVVRGTKLDTFYTDMSFDEVVNWLENHVVYDDEGNMICLFDNNDILWEDKNGGRG